VSLGVAILAVLLSIPREASAQSFTAIDLNPSGFTVSRAYGVDGGQQVGWGRGPATGGNAHALLWSGDAASVVDLHTFLPPGFNSSVAYGIDFDGNIVGWASGPATGDNSHAILWQLEIVPASGSLKLQTGVVPE
jgi:hypothetical protein